MKPSRGTAARSGAVMRGTGCSAPRPCAGWEATQDAVSRSHTWSVRLDCSTSLTQAGENDTAERFLEAATAAAPTSLQPVLQSVAARMKTAPAVESDASEDERANRWMPCMQHSACASRCRLDRLCTGRICRKLAGRLWYQPSEQELGQQACVSCRCLK